jgi:CBS domain-containing protein
LPAVHAGAEMESRMTLTRGSDELRVSDLMTREVITCPADTRLAAVASLLARRRVHAIFVVDESGQPAGVVSDFDLLGGEWMADDDEGLRVMQRMTAGELMTTPVETIGFDASAAAAAAHMRDLRVSRLLVTDDRGRPAGVIAASDLVAPIGRPAHRRQTVRDVMSHGIVTCLPETSLTAAARAMTERRSRSLVVVDERGRAVGVITGNDLLVLYRSDEQRIVAELMTTPVITCAPDLALRDAVDLMLGHEVHRLVVVDPARTDGVPVGMLSTTDVVAEMADERSDWQRTSD